MDKCSTLKLKASDIQSCLPAALKLRAEFKLAKIIFFLIILT